MRKARLINFVIWLFNTLLGTAIIVFLYRFILFPARAIDVEDLEDDSGVLTPLPVPETQKREVADYRPIWDDKLLKAPPKVAGLAAGEGSAGGVPFDQLFTLQLVTLIENFPEHGSVVVEKKGGEQRFLVVGDKWEGAAGPGTCLELKEVRLQSDGTDAKEYEATFIWNGQPAVLKYIEGSAGGSTARAPARTTPSAGRTTDPTEFKSYMDPSNPHRWFIDVRERDYALQNEAMIFNQIDMRPYVQDGVTIGMHISRVDSGSLPERRGLKVGDVIHAVNGVKVDSLEAVRRIVQDPSIRTADSVTVEMERAGQKMSVTFQIFVPR